MNANDMNYLNGGNANNANTFYNSGANAGYQNNGVNGNNANNNSNNNQDNMSESNPMVDRLLSNIIQLTGFEQRGNLNADIFNHPVQDMPFKIKGLLEPSKQQLTLPEGVPAPLSVLAAQPPFINDIRLINNIALEAQMCINGYSLQVPENVAFDFNPVA